MPPDSTSMMRYDAGKKSPAVAYLLWLFLGMFGAHRFYAGKTGSAVAILLLSLLGFGTIGFVLIIPIIWVLVDAFLIPGWIREHNNALIDRISRGS
ncbi:TM2 domain-containing protein [Pseudoroseomonas globiformis]|uniref:TM2 domain-containing protein n=1 Tax=Teichococcus globiformis TaxID=2307229 RepID=A0ABV7FU46_9PROT